MSHIQPENEAAPMMKETASFLRECFFQGKEINVDRALIEIADSRSALEQGLAAANAIIEKQHREIVAVTAVADNFRRDIKKLEKRHEADVSTIKAKYHAETDCLQEELKEAYNQISAIKASRFWGFTVPFRAAMRKASGR